MSVVSSNSASSVAVAPPKRHLQLFNNTQAALLLSMLFCSIVLFVVCLFAIVIPAPWLTMFMQNEVIRSSQAEWVNTLVVDRVKYTLFFGILVILSVVYMIVCSVLMDTTDVGKHGKKPIQSLLWWFLICLAGSTLFVSVYHFGVSNTYAEKNIQSLFKEGYMEISPKERFQIQNKFVCCGRMFYNESVCSSSNPLKCASSAILKNCVSEELFPNSTVDGGCVPNLVRDAKFNIWGTNSTFIYVVLTLMMLIAASGSVFFYCFLELVDCEALKKVD
jgi:hypothetical protein